jgi:hypothetical protein
MLQSVTVIACKADLGGIDNERDKKHTLKGNGITTQKNKKLTINYQIKDI